MTNPSPLRYPGGKYKLYKYIKKLVELKKLSKSTYIEPFCGGAAVGLELLLKGEVSSIIINDFDKGIYAFWYSVLNYTDELCNKIEKIDITIDEWIRQRIIQENKEKESLLNLGFSTLFLNRTNRSGIIKAGVIGGKNQNGNFKIDCRFNRIQLIKKIRKIAEYKEKIKLYNLDAIIFIREIILNLKQKSFIFFDPPYFEKGAGLYTNFYKEDDHKNLYNEICKIKYHSWVVTYDNKDEIKSIYKNISSELYKLTYSVQNKYRGEEIIFYSRPIVYSMKKNDISINVFL